MDAKDIPITPIQQAIASCSGALLTSLFVTPLDVVKIRLQAQGKPPATRVYMYHNGLMDHVYCVYCGTVCNNTEACVRNGTGATIQQSVQRLQPLRFNNTADAFVKIARSEGIPALWSGLPPTLVMAIPATVVYFTTYDILKYKFGYRENDRDTMYMPILAGFCARTFATVLISPLELVRTKMQSELLTYRELHKALGITIRECGMITLMRGLGPTLLRDVPFSGLYWFGYEYLKALQMRLAGNIDTTPKLSQSFIAGAVSGMFAAFVTTPFDVIKTHRQIELGKLQFCKDRHVTSTASLIMKLYYRNGPKALFAGLTPRLVKVTPACAIMIASYEYGKAFFRSYNLQKANSIIPAD